MAFEVTSTYVRDTVLASLIGRGARYEGILPLTAIDRFVEQEKMAAEQKLSTRFAPTVFQGWDGQGARPAPTAAVVDPPAEAIEIEPPYQWPSLSPSANFLTFRVRIRPVLELVGGTLRLPGAPLPAVQLLPNWFRVDSWTGELVLMPNFGGAALVMPNLPFGLFNWMNQRVPDGVMFTYRAGMDTQDWDRYPQINRMVAIRVAIAVLPALAMKINPTQVTSKSADGLSISRANGYVFKDLEDRLTKEADTILDQVLSAWEGSSALSIL